MKIKFIKEISRSEKIHYYNNGDIITSYFNRVSLKLDHKNFQFNFPISNLDYFLGKSRLIRRLFRLDMCNIFFFNKKDVVAIRNTKVYYYDILKNELIETLTLENCSCILNQSMCQDKNGHLYFGEYGRNKTRKPVNIYKSTNSGMTWEVIFSFKSGEIRHVHGCYYDKYLDKIWTLTGDDNGENIFMLSDIEFKSNKFIGDKSQIYRSVNIFINKNNIHWISDSPHIKNYHYSMNKTSYDVQKNQLFSGPVWYIKRLSYNNYIAATTVEKGLGVLSQNAKIYHTKNLKDWNCVAEFSKDIFPMPLFKWGVVSFSDGDQESESFTLHFEGLKKLDGKAYICSIN